MKKRYNNFFKIGAVCLLTLGMVKFCSMTNTSDEELYENRAKQGQALAENPIITELGSQEGCDIKKVMTAHKTANKENPYVDELFFTIKCDDREIKVNVPITGTTHQNKITVKKLKM